MKHKAEHQDYMLILLLFFSTMILAGCQVNETGDKPPVKETNMTEKQTSKQSIIPLAVSESDQIFFFGWLDGKHLLFLNHKDETLNKIFKYNIYTGEQELFFEGEAPINNVYISPDQQYIFVQTEPSNQKWRIAIVDHKGDYILQELIDGTELAVSWNQYDPTKLLVSSFAEDWSYTSYLISAETKNMEHISIAEPFVHWLSPDSFVYLDWSTVGPSIVTELKEQKKTGTAEVKKENVYFVDTFNDLMMTIGVNENHDEEARYTFMNNDFELVLSFSVPHLTSFSGWMVPQYAMLDKEFFYFKPEYSTDADTYRGSFDFMATDLETGEQTVLLEDMDNEPLSCSNKANACLYGHYLDKVILLDEKEVISLIKS
ncbi:YqgU-like beta propeller domain-containing protein [Cytobacillus kochii]|uniref:YqgU-like beta propeller domain-containing protein n=1 Tax=Cytobacillus kochii TaxID=859143 RepID=UPI00402AD7BD